MQLLIFDVLLKEDPRLNAPEFENLLMMTFPMYLFKKFFESFLTIFFNELHTERETNDYDFRKALSKSNISVMIELKLFFFIQN